MKVIKEKLSKDLTSIVECFDSKGEKFSRIYCIDNQGLLHGSFRQFWDNGQLLCDTNYNHGIIDGSYRTWYGNGQQRMMCHYKQGILNGSLKEYSFDGKLLREEKYVNGRQKYTPQQLETLYRLSKIHTR